MSSDSRLFSLKQRHATEMVCGGDGHADHVVPYSAGGRTDVSNCQMVSASVNRAKGAFVYHPRRWQKEFAAAWDGRSGQSFLLIVIPGGGKTMAAMEACRRWMQAGPDRRMVVVVPTDNLREQWREEAVKFGVQLQTKEFGTNFKDGFRGGVATYHYVANNSALFRKLCSAAPTMVVFDEVHHCGDEAHFGRGITEAFELARERLLLSGTAWRTDGTPIPFVKYDSNGYAIADFAYDYPRALNEEVVRYVAFDYSRGSITNDATGETTTLSSETSDEQASWALGRLLDPKGMFVREQIRMAHNHLVSLRASGVRGAAAIAACVDQPHAVEVARVIREVTGCTPSIIVSDSALENDTVREFRGSDKEWLVSVRKVSEGTDIKRLQVLCWLTNTTSELFFRQLVGRVARYTGGEDRQAMVFLPADPRLVACAKNIEAAQVQAIKEEFEREIIERDREPRESPSGSFSTSHEGTELLVVGSESLAGDHAEKVRQVSADCGLPMQKVMEVLQRYGAVHPLPTESAPASKEEIMDGLRERCNKVAFRLSKLLKTDVKAVHMRFKPQAEMTERELRRKLAALLEEGRRHA